MIVLMNNYHIVCVSALLFLATMSGGYSANDINPVTKASHVTIVTVDGSSSLLVNGDPFVVNGAGMGYKDNIGISSLADAGGNTFRTWDTSDLDNQLDAASKHGLMILAGLELGTQLQGFDYSDTAAIAEQHNRLLSVVERYRHHPNLLGWILGNEPNLMVNTAGQVVPADPKVYTAIGKLAREIKSIDSHHPVTVSFAFTATLSDDIDAALTAAPELDFVSLQAYGALPVIPQFVNDSKLPVPFMITEYGPLGHWEMPATSWGREIEEPSGHKAKGMRARMKGSVIDDLTGQLIGSFAFLWGHKQERTPTWYGLFLNSGERTSSVDELTQVWTGNWPDNGAPAAWSIMLQGQTADKSIMVKSQERIRATAIINDPENDALEVRWELLKEVDERSHGGHFEQRPERIEIVGQQVSQQGEEFAITFAAPQAPGEYRLFIYATDASNGGATANIPFLTVE